MEKIPGKFGDRQFDQPKEWRIKLCLEAGEGRNIREALLDSLKNTLYFFETLHAEDSAWRAIENHEVQEINDI